MHLLDVYLHWRRGSVEVEDDLLGPLVIVEPPLNHLADTLHPLPHALPGDLVQKTEQEVEGMGLIEWAKTREIWSGFAMLISPRADMAIKQSEIKWIYGGRNR